MTHGNKQTSHHIFFRPVFRLAMVIMAFLTMAHATDTLAGGQLIAKLENANITESSGICASRRTPGVFWTHNDSSAGSFLYAFDATGKDLGMFNYQTGSEDIEDIAAVQIDGVNYLLVGNTGNHAQVGARRRLYLIKEPIADLTTSRQSLLIPLSDLTVINFTWPNNENLDCEAVAINSKWQIFLATKENTRCRVFILTIPTVPRTQASLRQIFSPNISKVSAMDISPDGRSLLLMTNTRSCREYTIPEGAIWGQGSYTTTIFNYPSPVPGAPQPEGICYSADGYSIYATSELGLNTGSRASGGFRPGGQCPLYKMSSRFTPPVNRAPIAITQNISTFTNATKDITLLATDADNNALSYSIVSSASHGSLSGTAPNVTYQPTLGYIGSDSFTFSANDGALSSNIATVTITVTSAPVATYPLTVTNGNGDGSYAEGSIVTITADAAPSGQMFSAWTGNISGIASSVTATTTLTMPAAAATITATYITKPYALHVNMNGPATIISGNNWTAYSTALSQGLSIVPAPRLATSTITPSPVVDANTKTMLNSAIWNTIPFTINQTLPNGNYSVSLWVMENFKTNHRSFNVSLEGISKELGIGVLAFGTWKQYTYNTTVTDGQLNISLTPVIGEPGVMGLEIVSVNGIAWIDKPYIFAELFKNKAR